MNSRFFLITLICFAFCSQKLSAQVNVNATGGTASATYTTLGSAFAQINNGTHTGAITISITGNTTESASCMLSASGSGLTSYTRITISPSGGSYTISGAIAGDLIDLNGADNVKIDGLNTGGNALTIANSSTSTTSSAIRFINDAQNDTITNCTVTSSQTGSVYGTIVFGVSAGGTGNDNNVITNCTIAETGTNLPTVGVFCSGTNTSGQENSGITISGCNIANYFNPTSVTNGIFVSTGGMGWTISSNKLYQTATRTYTTANTHNGISVISGSGHTITGNTIGYAASNGTGTYTLAGTVATRFIGINLGVGTAAATSVQGNIIASINLATSSGAAATNGIICGINVTAGNVNIGTVTGNTIGAATGTNSIVATSTAAGGLLVGINSSSTGTIDIQNNTIGALSSSGTTAAIAGSVTGINVSGVATLITISNNTIGNGTANNLQGGTSGLTTGSSLVSGIHLPTTPTSATINGNTIQNLSSFGTGTTGFVRGIHTAISGTTTYTITNNTVNNLTTNNTNSSLSNGQLGAIGIFIGTGTSSVVSGNIISNISNSNSGAVSTNVAGISHAVAGNTVIRTNQIYNITNASTVTSTTVPGLACGVYVRGGLNNLSIINNMISLGTGQTTNTAFVGIIVYSGGGSPTVTQVFHNTVFIGGTVTTGAQPSMGFYRGNFSTSAVTFPVDVRNNIFVNTRTGGTGPHFAIANNYGATTASASGWGANFNVLNANSATIGHWTSAQTLSGWRTASSGDANSLSGITTTFTNSALGDLHLNMGTTPTQLESGGTTISGVNTDFDNQARPGPAGSVNGGAFAPDFGADEFDGAPLDLVPPIISFTAFGNGPVVLSRTVTATISDGNGVRVVTNGPQLYYKKTNDNNAFNGNTSADNGWKYVSASNVGSLFTFNIDYSLLTGGSVAVGDTIQYFIVAMDSTANNNVGISNGTLALTPTSTVLGSANFPITGTINSYRIVANLSGNVTVGVGGTYTSFTNTGGLFDDINNKFVSGNLTAQVISDISTETGAIGLLEFNASSQLTIVPDAPVLRTVSTTSAILLGLLGADNVTIDGRSGGNGKYLLFQNNNASTTSIALLISNAIGTNNGCRNINIKNVLFESGSTNLTAGTLVNNIHIQNNGHRKINIDSCEFKKAYNGLVIGAGTVTTNYDSLFITNNTFGEDLSTKYLTFSGIQLFFTSNSNVRNNVFKNVITSLTLNNAGVIVSTGASNVVVEQNRIFGIRSTNTGLYGSYGISVLAGTNITLKNNAIYNINSTSYNLTSQTDNLYGIRLAGANGVKVYNNSISIDGVSLNTTNAQYSACIANFGATNVEIVNNILRNAQTGFTGSKSYTLYLSTGTVTNASNNALFASGGNSVLALVGTTDYTTLSALQTATSAHANSFTVNPVYQDTNNNLTPSSCILNNRGVVLADVTNDLNGVTRSGTPDIGAIEFTPSTIAAPSVTTPVTFCKNVSSAPLTATGSNTLLWFMSASGGIGSNIAPTPSTTTAGSTSFFVADSSVVSGCISSRSQIVVNVSDSIYNNTIASTPQTICAGSTPSALTGSTPAGGTGTYTYTWLSSTTSATTGFVAASGTNNTQNYTPAALTQNTWFRRVVTSGSCSADTTLALAITVNTAIASNTASGTQTICSGSTPTVLTGSTPTGGNGSSYTYAWISSTTSSTNGFAAAGGTNNTQDYSPAALTQTTWFRRIVSSGACNADTSAAVLVIVTNAIANNIVSGAQTICSGTTPTALTGSTPTGGNDSSYTYAWIISTTSATTGYSAAVGTNNTQNYSPVALTQTTWFRRIVNSGACSADTSVAVAITVNPIIAGNTIGSNQSIL
nr:hypothetical protein [Bacteroidia bacterium]